MEFNIRKMTEDDLVALYRLLSDAQVMKYLEPPYTKEKTECFLQEAGLCDPPRICAAELDGCLTGYVIYHDYDERSVEIGWVLYPEYWGRGYASALTQIMIRKAFSSGKEVVIECVPQQEATRHIARKYGFTFQAVTDGLEVYRLRP
ncbi:MAG: GNAT family N-acetyltransferase [Solobacterium sp.]|nr:GNAT family N-acetyltransferase [Solobacterium sp.]